MAEENLKTKGTEVEEETGFWNRLNIPPAEYSVAGTFDGSFPLHSGFFYLP